MTAVPSNRPVVLLLDDEPALTRLLAATLGGEFEIVVAGTVEEAQVRLPERRYDALLCDHMLPGGKRGLDFLMEARRVQPEAKRILMTGFMNPEAVEQCTEHAGLSAVLLKPAPLQEFRQVLHEALGSSGGGAPA